MDNELSCNVSKYINLQKNILVFAMKQYKIMLKGSNGQKEFFKSKYVNKHISQSHTTVNAKTNYYFVCQVWECNYCAKNGRNPHKGVRNFTDVRTTQKFI